MIKIYIKGDKKVILAYLFPAIFIISVFLYYPLGRVLFKSFFYWDGFSVSKFIGFDNYIRLFHDPIVWKALKNTMILLVSVVVFQVGLGIVLALLVDMIKLGQNFFKTIYFFPIVIAGSALALLFQLFYKYDGGMFNSILQMFGKEPIVWLTEKRSLMLVIIPTVWQYVGFYFVIILTAITKIPESFYEAAKLEGANAFQRIIHITLPIIMGDIKVALILAITGTLKVFDFVFIITNGGPLNSSEVFGNYLYKMTFRDYQFGYGSAIAIVIIILGLVLTFLTNTFLKSEDDL
ncbi:MAG: sugar ABC transporter permease [Bacteroidota bacterium]|nr:sugar ABC transporter permease [Bacteroidota bacterium]